VGAPVTTFSSEHGFTRVDDDVRPRAWVECLDRLHAEPFYREYKARVRAMLDPRPFGRYLEVGSGVGTDALAVQATVIGVDRSLTMACEARARGLTRALVADADALPLTAASVDGCWSDRTFQHLVHPDRALAEMVRVLKVGGTIVVVDPDYGTQAMEFPDQHLVRKVLDYRAYRALRNGTLAHGMGGRFLDAGLGDVSVEEKVLVVRDPRSVDHVMGLRSWARAAMSHGTMTGDEVHRWETLYDETVARGAFLWSVTFFITTGRKRAA
jgi:SAM-dependent methyltransferase